jgi:CubicO group peptidase (beta-lactamase class C family)
MKNVTLFVIGLLLMSNENSSAFAQNAASLSIQLEQIRSSQQVPALGALLLQEGKVVDSAAVGVRKLGNSTPVAVNDDFHLGSDTKAMTATLTAIFVDEGKLSWTSTLGELFPEITAMNPAYKSVSVEMLLAHRSGLTGDLIHFNGGTLWQKILVPTLDPVAGRRMLVQEMLSQPPANPPGSTFEYSNQGYAMVGAILEKISGVSWETLIQDRLFKPLDMKSCGIGPLGNPGISTPDQPWAHQVTPSGIQPVFVDNPETIGPAGAVHCSMQDWAKFIQLHIDGFNGKPALLTTASFSKLHTSYPSQEYTYGGWIRTERVWANGAVFTHDGSNTFNYATVWWAPNRDLAVMAVSNIGAPSGQNACQTALMYRADFGQRV